MKTIPGTILSSLVLWGYQSGYLIPACLMGAVIELARVVNPKWDPSLDRVNKISDTCMICFAASVVFFVSQDLDTALANILCYLPMITFPLVVVQQYSHDAKIDIRALYLFKRTIFSKDSAAVKMNLSLGFIIICLISAAALNNRHFPYYPAAFTIIGIALFFQRPKGADIRVWIVAAGVAAIMGFTMQTGLHQIQKIMTRRALDRIFDGSSDPLQGSTALGHVGRLKLSNRIVFRVIPPENDPRETYLLQEAAYTFLSGNIWNAAHNHFTPVPQSGNGNFLTGLKPIPNSSKSGVQQAAPRPGPGQKMTILTRMKKKRGVLRVPENALVIHCSAISSIETNGLGTFVTDDAPGFITYDVRYGAPGTDICPPGKLDLFIPEAQKALFTKLAKHLQIGPGKPDHAVLSEIKTYFYSNFTYTLDLKKTDRQFPFRQFLTQTRAGHCEYFAAATVFLLRAAGIPARYVSGYMAFEKDFTGNKIVVRRKHAHAWTQAYVNGQWVFFDTTPPSWIVDEDSAWFRTAVPDLFSLMGYGLAQLRWGTPGVKKKVLWLMVPLGVLIIRRLLRKDKKKRPQNGLSKPIPDVADFMIDNRDFYIQRLEAKLADKGYTKKTCETYEQFFIRIRETAFSRQEFSNLMTIIRIHKQLRFGPGTVSADDTRVLKTLTDRLIQTLPPG